MPTWVVEAMNEYQRRLQDGVQVQWVEIPLLRRGKSTDLTRILEKEMQLMSAAIPANARVIALDLAGKMFSSEQLAVRLQDLQHISSHLCFLIGGPEGLAASLVARSDERWSLSMLTLPHPLVRVVLMEALYRAWSIIHHHPYHK